MEELTRGLGDAFQKYIVAPFTEFNGWDFLDITILAVFLYGIYLFFRGRRAGKLAVGVAVVFVLYAVSDILELRAVHQILSGITPFSVILLAIIFQSELRGALERLGNSPLTFFTHNGEIRADLANTVNEVVDAVCRIALSEEDGALIVIERTTPLGDYTEKGQPLDSIVSSNILCNLFVNRSPLHDGAVIIRGNRVATAGSKLPLSVNEDVVKNMGTRHRAAVGITEVSDCVVVVVSEERHLISIANNGLIKRDYHRSPNDLRSESSMKNIQNALRNDLLRLLAGTDYDEQRIAQAKHGNAGKNTSHRRAGKKGEDAAAAPVPAAPAEAQNAAEIQAPVIEEMEIPDQMTIDQITSELPTGGESAPAAAPAFASEEAPASTADTTDHT